LTVKSCKAGKGLTPDLELQDYLRHRQISAMMLMAARLRSVEPAAPVDRLWHSAGRTGRGE
jgi:hypothetical protein